MCRKNIIILDQYYGSLPRRFVLILGDVLYRILCGAPSCYHFLRLNQWDALFKKHGLMIETSKLNCKPYGPIDPIPHVAFKLRAS